MEGIKANPREPSTKMVAANTTIARKMINLQEARLQSSIFRYFDSIDSITLSTPIFMARRGCFLVVDCPLPLSWERFPAFSGFSRSFIKNGTMTTADNNEAVRAIMRVRDTSFKIIPTTPVRAAMGTKTTTVVAVLAKMDNPTSSAPNRIAACGLALWRGLL